MLHNSKVFIEYLKTSIVLGPEDMPDTMSMLSWIWHSSGDNVTRKTNYMKNIYIPEVLSAKKNKTGYVIRGVLWGARSSWNLQSKKVW